ncbi:MAG: hypothetical protein ACK5IJ_06075 [Mangrovibacterium sp.]
MKLFVYLIYLGILSCSNNSKNVSVTKTSYIVNDAKIERDKEQIANCFIENVEYFRQYHRYDDKVYIDDPDSIKAERKAYCNKYPGADRDPANFFEPYATRFSLEKDEYINSTLPTDSQLKVVVDSIVYSRDSLFCVAFLVIELKYDNIKGLENARVEDRRFDGKAVIGYRDGKEKPFSIYPITNFSITGFQNYKETVDELEYLYFNMLKNSSLGGIYKGHKFNQNVGDKDFFNKSPYFKKHKNGMYNFMMYRYLGKEYQYNYQFCE